MNTEDAVLNSMMSSEMKLVTQQLNATLALLDRIEEERSRIKRQRMEEEFSERWDNFLGFLKKSTNARKAIIQHQKFRNLVTSRPLDLLHSVKHFADGSHGSGCVL